MFFHDYYLVSKFYLRTEEILTRTLESTSLENKFLLCVFPALGVTWMEKMVANRYALLSVMKCCATALHTSLSLN